MPESPPATGREAELNGARAVHLSVQMRHRVTPLEIDVNFKLTQPWTILFGPSGSGKTTILRAISGLLRPDFAKIVSSTKAGEGTTLIDTDGGTNIPPHQRRTPLASQRATLFPHMSVRENLEYGERAAGGFDKPDGLHPLIADLPRLFHVEDVLDKRPAQLSGGEAQRVSLARAAMAGNYRLLLLDEPFTGLDLPLRDSLLANLLAWQDMFGTPILSVTHDVGEAFQLGAEVIKIADGKVVQQGPVDVVLAGERAQLLRQLNGVPESRE